MEEVIRNARTLAGEHGADPGVVEEVYRATISGFVSLEMDEHARNKANDGEEGL